MNNTIRNTQSALRDVNRLLKLDPKNSELLAQKQKLLQQAIEETSDKLNALKDADKQAKHQLDNGKLGQDQYDALQREIIETQQSLFKLQEEFKKVPNIVAQSVNEIGDKLKSIGDKTQDVGKKMSTHLTLLLVGVGVASVSAFNEVDEGLDTIEVANDEYGGNWHVSDVALQKTIDLCVDICQRNGIKRLNYTGDTSGNLTKHEWFAKTDCPGPYLGSKFPYIADEVNKRLGGQHIKPKGNNLYRVRQSWQDVKSQKGAFKNLANAKQCADKYKLNVFDEQGNQVYPEIKSNQKSVDEVAQEVLNGLWGNGQDRKERLTKAGYDYSVIQNKVNELVTGIKKTNLKPIEVIAREVINGDWGNGQERKNRLQQAGYDYQKVQEKVNEMI